MSTPSIRVFFLSISLFSALSLFSQDSSSYIKVPSLGGSIFLKDFPDAAKITKLNHENWSSPITVGLSGQFITGLTKRVDYVVNLGATITQYKRSTGLFYDQEKSSKEQHHLLLDFENRVNLKLFTDIKKVVPYLTSGIGASLYNLNYVMIYIPWGAGLQFNLKNDYFLYTQLNLQEGITNPAKHNFDLNVGFSVPLKKKKIAVVVKPKVELDTDGDGIVDSKDSCPSIAGLVKYNGCPIPDTDKDGVNDEEDSCPSIAGLAKYHGCPIPDTDKDGINDEDDSCPTVPGLAKYHGCPIPDKDGDGINDEEDKCPTERGTIENKGCPEIQSQISELARNIFFNSGSSVINPKASPILDQVISIMYKYPLFKLEIEGHTDNVGSPIANQKTSQKRADAIKDYFVSRGISASRLYSIGYGLEKPIATNKTATGRALNRRVELHAKY